MSPHGGNVRKLAEAAGVPPLDLIDFSASINPLGPPEWLPAVVAAHLHDLRHYPDPDCSRLVEAIGARYGVARERVVAGNGSAEIIAALPRVLGARSAIVPVPAYVDYAVAAGEAGLAVRTMPLDEATGFTLDLARIASLLEGDEMVFVGRPNNPTGLLCPREELLALVSAHPRSWFVVDEAFVELASDEAGRADRGLIDVELSNLVVVRSLTKLYAIPGLRLGFVAASPEVAAALRRAMAPWSVNSLAQAVGAVALTDDRCAHAARSFVRDERRRLAERLGALPAIRVYPGSANFLLVRTGEGWMDAGELAERLLRRGMAIRVCDDFEALDRHYFRVAVRTREENERLVECIRAVLEPRPDNREPRAVEEGVVGPT